MDRPQTVVAQHEVRDHYMNRGVCYGGGHAGGLISEGRCAPSEGQGLAWTPHACSAERSGHRLHWTSAFGRKADESCCERLDVAPWDLRGLVVSGDVASMSKPNGGCFQNAGSGGWGDAWPCDAEI